MPCCGSTARRYVLFVVTPCSIATCSSCLLLRVCPLDLSFTISLVPPLESLRVDLRGQPPYSYHLIYSTLGWLPWAVLLHVGFAFWGFASLPSQPLGVNTTWAPPFGNTSVHALFLGVVSSSTPLLALGSSNSSSSSSLDASMVDALTAVTDALSYVYDLPGHVNSVPSLILFIAACVVLLHLVLLRLRASPLYLPLAPLELALVAAARACARVICRRAGKVYPMSETELIRNVVDPPFDQVLRGAEHTNIRTTDDGRVVTEAQLELSRMGCWARIMSFSITPLIFRLLGLYEHIAPVSEEEWSKATPVFTRLTRAADISYQPEYHPSYERAFVYLAEPERLQAYTNRPTAHRAASSVGEDEWLKDNEDEGTNRAANEEDQDDAGSEDSDFPFSDDPDKIPLCAIL